MGPTSSPPQQADLEKQAYFARHSALTQHLARLEHDLQRLVPPSLTTTLATESSYEHVQAQVAFRRKLGGLQSALAKARARIRCISGDKKEQHHHHLNFEKGGRRVEEERGEAAATVPVASDKIEVYLASVQDGLHALALAHRREFEALRWQERVLTKDMEKAMTTAAAAPGEKDNREKNYKKKTLSTTGKSKSAISTSSKMKAQQSQARVRVMEIQSAIAALDEEILAHGGLTGGWQAEEHEKFLALWRDFRGHARPREEEEEEDEEEEEEEDEDPVAEVKGNLLFLDRAVRVLWSRSEGEVMRHVEWYVKHRHRIRTRALRVRQRKEAEEEARREEEEKGWNLDEVTRKRRLVAEWRRRRQLQEEEEEEAQKLQMWEAQQRKAAQEKRRAALTRKQLARHREEKEERERQQTEEQARLEEEMEEEAEYRRLVHEGKGGREDEKESPNVLKLVLERRARLSLRHAKERRERAWAMRPMRQAEERSRRQQAVLQEVAWEEAMKGNGDDVMSQGGAGGERMEEGKTRRSLPRFVYRDVGRLNQSTEASSRRAYDGEELDAKDTARLFCLAHERPLPPGF